MNVSPDNPLRKPGYRYFLLYSACGAMGGGFHFVAGYWMIFEHTSSPSSVALLILAFWAPSLLVLPLGGVLVDRCNRRRTLAVLYAYLTALNAGLVLLLAAGVFRPTHLYYYGLASSMAHALIWTALTAYLQEAFTHEELLHANSLNVALFQGGYLLGAGAAGLFYTQLGPMGCFLIDAGGCAAATVGWFTINRWIPDRPRQAGPPANCQTLLREFSDGIRYIASDLPLFSFTLFMLIPRVAAQTINVLHVGFSAKVLETGPIGFGLMDMAYGLGAVVCGLAFPMLVERRGVSPLLPLVSLCVATTCLLEVGRANDLVTAMLALAVLGGAANVVGVLARTMLQREASSHIIGRVTSTVQLCQYIVIPIIVWTIGQYASLRDGRLLHLHPLRDAFVLAAVMFALLALAAHFAMAPVIRRRWRQDNVGTRK